MKHIKASIFFISFLIVLALWSLFAAVTAWVFVAILLSWFAVALTGSSFLILNYHVKALCHNPNEKEKKIALTFDDGPDPNTLKILEILKRYGVKATFFCIGHQIEKNPEVLKQVIADGHLIGNHSYSHSQMFDFYRKDRVAQELRETDNLIAEFTGMRPKFFRPPYGVTTPSIRRALQLTKHQVIGWNIRSMDGITKNTQAIFNRIIKRLSPGSVVLLHDNRPQANVVLEQLLQSLREKKYEVVSLETLLNCKAYEN